MQLVKVFNHYYFFFFFVSVFLAYGVTVLLYLYKNWNNKTVTISA